MDAAATAAPDEAQELYDLLQTHGRMLPADQLAATVRRMEWLATARDRNDEQLLPDGEWNICIYRCGRGWGKSRCLSEIMWWEMYTEPGAIGHYLGATLSDVRGTLFEGHAGLLNKVPPEILLGGSVEKAYNKSIHELRFANGSLVRGFATTEQAERLRGPQCHVLCCDEAAAWDRPAGNLETALNNAMYGLRLKFKNPNKPAFCVIGTTPRPIPFLKKLEKRRDVVTVTGSSYSNLANLSAAYQAQLLSNEGTLFGKQEIHGAYVDEESDISIWKRHWLKLWPADRPLPEFLFVLESYDTAFSEEHFDAKTMTADPTACVVLGVFNLAQVYSEDERRKMGLRARYGVLLCDAWSERLGFPELVEKARKQHATKWGKPGRKADVILIEDKGSGISLRQTLVQYGLPTWPYNPHRESKAMRAHAVAPLLKDGLFFLPESGLPERKGMFRNWCEPYLEQICGYAGKNSLPHDDWVDATSQAMLYLKNRDFLETDAKKKFVDFEDERNADRDESRKIHETQKRQDKGNPYA